jgi:hypothetical protein
MSNSIKPIIWKEFLRENSKEYYGYVGDVWAFSILGDNDCRVLCNSIFSNYFARTYLNKPLYKTSAKAKKEIEIKYKEFIKDIMNSFTY